MSEVVSVFEFDEPDGLSTAEVGYRPSMRVVHLEGLEPLFTVPSSDRDKILRRFSTLFVDETRTRVGGNAEILHATNAFGEHFALKKYAHKSTRETEAYCAVSGVRGFSTLFAQATLDGKHVLVMEWLEGEDLLKARTHLEIDDEHRISPLLGARIGRDLFDVLARTSILESTFVHCDLSPRNVMISTINQPIEEQVQEGSFDIRVIDLGSACVDIQEQTRAGLGRPSEPYIKPAATPEFAPPELQLSSVETTNALNDAAPSNVAYSAITPAADVFAASKILCSLVYGNEQEAFRSVHCRDNDLSAILMREPEVAVAVNHAASDLAPSPSAREIELALEQVDAQLADILRCGIDPDQAKRPSAEVMRDALDSFARSYRSNIGYALRGEDLEPVNAPFANKGYDRISLRVRNTIRVIGKSASWGLLAAVVLITAFSVFTTSASFSWEGVSLGGVASQAVSIFLLLPLLVGMMCRGKDRHSFQALIRSTIGIAVSGIALVFIVSQGSVHPTSIKPLLTNAAFAATVMSWCPMVLDVVFPSQSARVRTVLRALLGFTETRSQKPLDESTNERKIEEGRS